MSYGGYKLQPYPLVYFSKLLMMKESEVESLCIDCGLEISNDETGKGLISTKQSVISKQSRGFQKYYPFHSERIESPPAATAPMQTLSSSSLDDVTQRQQLLRSLPPMGAAISPDFHLTAFSFLSYGGASNQSPCLSSVWTPSSTPLPAVSVIFARGRPLHRESCQ